MKVLCNLCVLAALLSAPIFLGSLTGKKGRCAPHSPRIIPLKEKIQKSVTDSLIQYFIYTVAGGSVKSRCFLHVGVVLNKVQSFQIIPP
jgi:hypothetical protein